MRYETSSRTVLMTDQRGCTVESNHTWLHACHYYWPISTRRLSRSIGILGNSSLVRVKRRYWLIQFGRVSSLSYHANFVSLSISFSPSLFLSLLLFAKPGIDEQRQNVGTGSRSQDHQSAARRQFDGTVDERSYRR